MSETYVEPVHVHLASSDVPLAGGRPKRRRRALKTNTFTLTSVSPTVRVMPQSDSRVDGWITSATSPGATTVTTPTPVTPAVPASTVAVQNTNSYAVQVVISGGTMTAVIVNGITVGAGAGTYVVPAFGAISMTYTVAPTWAWTAAVATSSTATSPVVFIARTQADANSQSGGSAQIVGTDTTPFPVSTTDEVWISAAAGFPVTVSVVQVYELEE